MSSVTKGDQIFKKEADITKIVKNIQDIKLKNGQYK